MPSGRTAHPHITDNKDGTVTVKYSPTERGLHEMDIKYDGSHIPGKFCLAYLLHVFQFKSIQSEESEIVRKRVVLRMNVSLRVSVLFVIQEVLSSSMLMPSTVVM